MHLSRSLVVVVLLAALAAAQSLPYTPALNPASMDKSADPCVDFYQYACGGWMKNNPIPADQSSWSVYSKLQKQNRELLRHILERAAVPDPQRAPAEQKIGDYYASCMDEKAIEAAGAKPLQPDLDRIAALKSKDGLPELLARLHPNDIYIYFGHAPLFSFGSSQDAKKSTEFIADLDQGGIGLPDRDYYLKNDARSEELRKKYLAHVARMLQLLGDKPQVAGREAQAVMRIETALAEGMLGRVERRDPKVLYHKMTVAELQALSPSFRWRSYLAGVGLEDIKSLNVDVPAFIRQMDQVLKSEDLDSLKAYLRWHLVHAQARYLSSAFVQEDFDFYDRTLTGAREMQPRWKRCVRYTDRALSEALGQAYVARVFGAETKQRAEKMVQGIEQAMDRDIRQLSWMSEPTKEQALAKLHAVINKIGYPEHWRDYSALKIVRGDNPGNGERATAFEFYRWLRKIGQPLDRGEWLIPVTMVNAYYNLQMNDINFTAAVLQPPLFDPRMDDAVNYGDTGATMGHELTHGFDDEGRQFDAHGNLRDWWTPKDAKEFERRANCISGQYSQYVVVDDVKINGKLTLGEDVADLGGLRLAWMAWQEKVRDKKLKPIDGLTPEQRFFVGYGQSWCSNQRPEVQRLRAATDPHSPPKYRTNGVVSNLPEFWKAFGCKQGQPMRRENACRVW